MVNNFFIIDPDNIDFVFPKYDPKINHNLKRNQTNLRSKELIYLSYNENDWLNLYNKSKKYYQFFSDLNRNYFLLKFKVKNLFYRYFN